MGLQRRKMRAGQAAAEAYRCRRQPDQRDLRRGDSADGGYQAAAREQTAQKRLPKRRPKKRRLPKRPPQEKPSRRRAYHGVLALVIGVCVVLALGIGFAGQVNAAKV